MKNILLILCASFLLIGCSTNSPVGAMLGARPDPGTSEFLHTKGGGFALQVDDKQKTKICQYSLLLTPTKSITSPLYLQARFENPAGGAPLIIEGVLQPSTPEVLLTSPPVTGLRSWKSYRVDVGVFEDAARTKEISTHTQYIRSFINL